MGNVPQRLLHHEGDPRHLPLPFQTPDSARSASSGVVRLTLQQRSVTIGERVPVDGSAVQYGVEYSSQDVAATRIDRTGSSS